jgi:hypothetical protein
LKSEFITHARKEETTVESYRDLATTLRLCEGALAEAYRSGAVINGNASPTHFHHPLNEAYTSLRRAQRYFAGLFDYRFPEEEVNPFRPMEPERKFEYIIGAGPHDKEILEDAAELTCKAHRLTIDSCIKASDVFGWNETGGLRLARARVERTLECMQDHFKHFHPDTKFYQIAKYAKAQVSGIPSWYVP